MKYDPNSCSIIPLIPILKSCNATYNEDVIAHSAKVPTIWYVSITTAKLIKETLFVLLATKAAAIANTIDFVNIAGSIVKAGIPNIKLLMTGDNVAVSKPTLIPYLYDAIKVKK